jgi:beta-glucosidase
MGITVLPAGVHAASTWDLELIRQRGFALGQEAKGLGIHIQLGPVAGPLGKIPHGGRNWEGVSICSTKKVKILILGMNRILS